MSDVRQGTSKISAGLEELVYVVAETVRANSATELNEFAEQFFSRIDAMEGRLNARIDAVEERVGVLIGESDKKAESRSAETRKLIEGVPKYIKPRIDMLHLNMDAKVLKVTDPLTRFLKKSESMESALQVTFDERLGETERAIGGHVDRVGSIVDSAYEKIKLSRAESEIVVEGKEGTGE